MKLKWDVGMVAQAHVLEDAQVAVQEVVDIHVQEHARIVARVVDILVMALVKTLVAGPVNIPLLVNHSWLCHNIKYILT